MEDDQWVFESLVGFLSGPIWNIPVMNFIENRSSVFDPSHDDQSEYNKIHDEYKHLVDLLLSSFMEDIGITAEQFGNACAQDYGNQVKRQLRETLFEQVRAADNLQVFTRMMSQKNIELQLQALEYLKDHGHPVDPNYLSEQKSLDFLDDEDDEELKEAIRKSLEEHEESIALYNQEKEDLERALAATLEDERLRLRTEHKEDNVQLNVQKPFKTSHETTVKEKVLPPLNHKKQTLATPNESQCSKVPDHLTQEIILETPVQQQKEQVQAEEIAKRRAFLLEQRDKLVARKHQERKIQLDSSEEASGNRRPKSAKVARDVMENDACSVEGGDTDPDMLAARRALAARLKAEVVGNNQI